MLEILIVVLQFLAEIALQAFVEVFADVIGSAFSSKKKRRREIWPHFSGLWAVCGGFAGVASTVVFPHLFIIRPPLRLINLIFTPLIIGGIMAMIGRFKTKQGREATALESFFYGTLFAFGMAGARYLLAR